MVAWADGGRGVLTCSLKKVRQQPIHLQFIDLRRMLWMTLALDDVVREGRVGTYLFF
jgi:hypothetical protein